MFNQYLLILGDFGNFKFDKLIDDGDMAYWYQIENMLVIMYFVLSTFMTQIVILNMLVAIMSATFGHHNA